MVVGRGRSARPPARCWPSSIGDGVEVDDQSRRLTAPVSGRGGLLMEALRRFDAEHIKLSDVALRRPTLDDVFLSLTGHASEDSDE